MRLGDFLERARQIDDANPWHDFECARRRACDDAAFGGAVTILRDDRGRIERRRRAQHRTDIVRIGDLIEDDQRALAVRVNLLLQQIAEKHVVERVDFDHQSLMRRVARNESRKVGDLGIGNGNHRRQVELTERFARAPDALYGAIGVGERRQNGVATPEANGLAARVLTGGAAMAGKLSHNARPFP